MKYVKLALGTVAGVAFAASASAGTVGIGSTKAGAVAQITATISKVVSEAGVGIQMRKQTMGGTQQYIPVVNAGELDFGISNMPQYYMAITGTGLSKGTKYDKLRLVANMMKFSVGFVVPMKSDVKKISDLKGKRLAHGFKAAPLFANLTAGGLATVGLSYNDVEQIPAVGLVQHWRMFMEGKIDGVIAAAGSGFIKQMNAKISGGVHYVSFPHTDKALAGMHKFFPRSYWSVIKPGKGLTAVRKPVTLITYDYMLWTHASESDETVYNVAKIMYTKAADLKEGGPLWKSYNAKDVAKNEGADAPYHPAAIKFYKEAGVWPGK